jgi:intein/homing endonuclease
VETIKKSLPNAKLVYEQDDNLFDLHKDNPAYWYFSNKQIQATIKELYSKSDALIVTTDFLKDQLTKYTDRPIYVVENLINTARFKPINREPSDEITITWGGGDSHNPDIKIIHGIYKYIESRYPNVHFKFIGFLPPFLDLQLDRYERVDWGTIDSYAEAIADSDICLAPLTHNIFNDAKCLDESTLVPTREGIKRISELIVGDMIYNGESFKEVQAVNKEESKLGKKIITKSGVEILATNNHRLLINGDWQLAENIKSGDTLTKTKIESNSNYQTAKFPLFHSRMTRKEYGNNTFDGESMPSITIDETWGKLLGIFAGDGSCNYTTMNIHIDGIDSDVIDIVQDLFKNIGMNTSTNNVLCKNGKLNRRRVVRVSSSRLLDFIEYLGLAEQIKNTRKTRRRIIKVPDVIFKSPSSVISSFLSGLFEADGSVYGTCVDLSSKNKEFLADIQTLLLLFGCNSRLYKSSTVKNKDYYKLFLTREFCEVFENKIGFISKRKQEKLNELTSKKHSNAYKEYNWEDEIISIEDHYLTPIDIQVDGEKFVANGIISHNSSIKMTEAAACGVPAIGSKEPPYETLPSDIFPLCRKEKDWVKWLTRFIENEDMRKEYAKKQREYVLDNVNLWKNITKRINTYAEIVGEEPPDPSTLNLTIPDTTPEPPEEYFKIPPAQPTRKEMLEQDFNMFIQQNYSRTT